LLGLGEKNVGVPFNAIQIKVKDGKRYLVTELTKEALYPAPAYTMIAAADDGWLRPRHSRIGTPTTRSRSPERIVDHEIEALVARRTRAWAGAPIVTPWTSCEDEMLVRMFMIARDIS